MRVSGSLAMSLCAACLAACGGGGGGGGEPDAGGLTCGPAELRLEGELDGAPVSWQYAVAGLAQDNTAAASPCWAIAYLDGGGRLKLEWPAPLAEGGAGEARGELSAQAQGGEALGNCAADGFPGRVTRFSPGEIRFELTSLRELPACSGAARAGSLRGCARYP